MVQKVYKIRIKKNDRVMVRSGKYKGQTGKVIAILPRENKITVEGINIVKKHIKPNKQYPQGGIVEVNKPIWVSKVGIIDPLKKRPTRIGYSVKSDGTKTRVFKASSKEIV